MPYGKKMAFNKNQMTQSPNELTGLKLIFFFMYVDYGVNVCMFMVFFFF